MKISVIVPVYNVEEYLAQCLDSIVGQTYHDLEIILVDDGSTDDSAKICDDFAAKDSRIRVVHQKNGGVSVARNTGIEAATGEYITFVDSDDWLDEDIYKLMAAAVQSNPDVNMVMCDFITVQNAAETKIPSDLFAGLYSKKDIIHYIYPRLVVTEDFGRLPIVSACTCIFNKDLFVNHGIHFDVSLRYSEDYLFMAAVMTHCESFYYVKDYFGYRYRQYGESRSKKYQPEWWNNLLYLNKELEDLLSTSKEFDFTQQIKLQLIHSALFLAGAIFNNKTMMRHEKLNLLRKLFNEPALKESFSNLPFNKHSLSLKIVLNLMKKKMALSYLIYRNIVSKLK